MEWPKFVNRRDDRLEQKGQLIEKRPPGVTNYTHWWTLRHWGKAWRLSHKTWSWEAKELLQIDRCCWRHCWSRLPTHTCLQTQYRTGDQHLCQDVSFPDASSEWLVTSFPFPISGTNLCCIGWGRAINQVIRKFNAGCTLFPTPGPLRPYCQALQQNIKSPAVPMWRHGV